MQHFQMKYPTSYEHIPQKMKWQVQGRIFDGIQQERVAHLFHTMQEKTWWPNSQEDIHADFIWKAIKTLLENVLEYLMVYNKKE